MNAIAKLIGVPLGFLVLALGASAETVVNNSSSKVVVPKPAKTCVTGYHRATSVATFALAGDAKITFGANTNASLNDLTTGEVAHVSYTIENGVWLAQKVEVNPVHQKSTTTSQPHATCQPHAAKTNELHAHGKITSYNVSAGTISIVFHR
jgi:hypothetical protein